MKKVKYHLRFQIAPCGNVKQDARILADFCLKHGIEEVVLFFAAEEWNNGLLSQKEEDMWFASVGTAKEVLESKGLSVSLNPWMTVLHTDRGRTFPSDRRFNPMVSPLGEKSRACASFADKKWQKYIYGLYGRFARLGFRVIWVEDDFRYHNHGPLTWGGGFENLMCENFSRKAGKKVGREEILKKILKPGKPHPWRRLWMEVWRETQIEVAKGIADAVKKNSPVKTKIGLMSSSPWIHSIEGRRWKETFNALSIDGGVAHRPHFAFYCDTVGSARTYSIMSLGMQKNFRENYCEVAPEVENFPFTAWSKSDSSTWSDMAFALFFGSDALLLDLFPFSGNRADEEPQIGKMLDKSCGALSWIAGRFSKEHNLYGIGVPWKEDAAETVRTEKGERLNELAVDTMPAWDFLLQHGIPVCAEKQEVNAVFGNTAWIFSDNEISDMLKGGLLLDGESAQILSMRGFGKHIGVECEGILDRESSKYSMEMVNNENSGLRKGFYFSVNLMKKLWVFEPAEGAESWTDVITPENRRIGSGLTLYKNSLGGRTAVFAVGNPSELSKNFQRQAMVRNAVKYLYGGKVPFPLVSGTPHLLPLYFRKKGEDILVVFNGSMDPAAVDIDTGRKKTSERAVLLKPLEKPGMLKLMKEKGNSKNQGLLKITSEIPHMSFIVVKLKRWE